MPETLVSDVALGQQAKVDTRTGVIEGVVSRIDPAAIEGTVLVDIRLLGGMPRGVRPDLGPDGTIELDRLEDVLHMGRPIHAREDGMMGLAGGRPNACRVRPSAGGQGLGEHDRNPRGAERGRRGGPVRHVGVGRLREDPARIGSRLRGPGRQQAKR